MTYTKARQKYYKHQLFIVNEKDVNLEKLLSNKVEKFDFFMNGKGSLNKVYSDLYAFSELKKANLAVIKENHHSLKGVLYFYPKLDVHSNKELFKSGTIGVDASQSKDYSFVKRREDTEK